ncbi:MAG: glycosyltransferase [Alphaproteobacteria bacterium]|nr:glycosyltransferase [Alphaproteobacteria bacterium]
MPKISIIVPVYNVEQYLPKCLDSLINQTLKDIEIICVNDGSTDGSLSVLKDYAQKDKRIRIIDKENSGPGACRNMGIEKATGEFIQFVDSDDWIEPETCEVCYQKAKEHNVDMVSFNALFHKKEKSNPYIYYNINEEKIITWQDISRVLFQSHFNVWHYIFKKSLLDKHLIRFPNIVMGEDVPFTLNAWLSVKGVYIIPKLFYHYDDSRETSICRSYHNKVDTFSFLEMSRNMISPFQSKSLNESFSMFKLVKLFYEYRKEIDVVEQKKFKKFVKKICTESEYKKFISACGYQRYLFGRIPLFEANKKKNKTIYKVLGINFLSILKKTKRSQRTDKKDYKKTYKLLGVPFFKIKKKYNFYGYKKFVYFCGICVYKKSKDKLNKKIASFNKKYQKTLKRLKIKVLNKEKIRVAFYVNDSKFKTQKLFNLMKKNKYYHPFVLVGKNSVQENSAEYQTQEEVQKIFDYFKKNKMEVYFAYDFESNKPIPLKTFKPDIIFYSRQYALAKEHKIDVIADYSLPVYVPYFVPNSPLAVEAGSEFHNLLWKYFILNAETKANYSPVMQNKGENLVVTGHPILDVYLEQMKKQEKYVIYAPHWSVGDTLLNYSTFEWSGKFMLEWAQQHPEFKWVFKPHPMLYNRLITSGYMTKEEVEKYYSEWEKIGIYYSGPDYFDYFKNSKALITDCGSFIAEYLPTEKPVILMRSSRATPYNFLGKIISNSYYNIHNSDELTECLEKVLVLKNDDKKSKRIQTLTNLNLIQNASNNIIKVLNRELGIK